MRLDTVVVAGAVTLLVIWLAWQTVPPDPVAPERLRVENLMSGETQEFRRVTGPIPLSFPEDHAQHPSYQNEWWYFTGNLETPAGERLGFQYTLFRFATSPGQPMDSAWQTEAMWMAHLALSDGRQQRFFQAERFARGSLGLAGADPDRWWLRDWQVALGSEDWQLEADAGDFALDLSLTPIRPIVLQGDNGYSRKGPDPGNASRYYSITRLATTGNIRIGDEVLSVQGLSWLDREWGSSQLSEEQAGWDWFAIQLEDGRDLMLAGLRNKDGSDSDWSYGLLVEEDGRSVYLTNQDYVAEVERRWTDSKGDRWPVEWQISVPSADLSIRARAVFDNQHWRQSVDYWEGMIDILDQASGEPIGRGYLELSGYGE
ncbi:MAG TPA: lipocalin-like domain-containing protein [Wenzhouxiangella sp.]|nr:lipocalin-like domain-containing protein [Wenzhouxiangella sp.]